MGAARELPGDGRAEREREEHGDRQERHGRPRDGDPVGGDGEEDATAIVIQAPSMRRTHVRRTTAAIWRTAIPAA
nr:hypothetical protein GCM10025732_05670 [Glycomyces mayteni]